jgi:TM2 domain-containing membrane protein YozV
MKKKKQYVIRFLLICTSLSAPFFSSGQESLGDSLSMAGKYKEAGIAYEYAIYKGGHKPDSLAQLVLKRAYAYKFCNEFEKAFSSLQRIDIYELTDSMANTVLYESALNALLSGRPDQCLSKLEETKLFQLQTHRKQVLLLEIFALNEMRQWDLAHSKFLQFSDEFKVTYEDPYLNKSAYKMKNPDKANNISYFLPGVGQMYAGHFWKGVFSGFINLATLAFAGVSFWNGYYLSGAFTGITFFYIFYNGGGRYAQVLTEQHNEQKAKRFNQGVKKIMLSSEY